MAKTAPFSMRMEGELKKRLQKLADADRRSLTNYVEGKLWEVVEAEERAKRNEKRQER